MESRQVRHRHGPEDATDALLADLTAGIEFLRMCIRHSSDSSEERSRLLQILGAFEETVRTDSHLRADIARVLARVDASPPRR